MVHRDQVNATDPTEAACCFHEQSEMPAEGLLAKYCPETSEVTNPIGRGHHCSHFLNSDLII